MGVVSEFIGSMRARMRRTVAHAADLARAQRRKLYWLILAAALLPLLPILFVTLVNGELSGRGIDAVDIGKNVDTPAFTITAVIHRLIPEENAAELSFTVTVDPAEISDRMRGRDNCATLVVWNRDPDRVTPPQRVQISCRAADGFTYPTTQTGRIALPAYPSVAGFPFDYVHLWPDARVSVDTIFHGATNIRVVKQVPGRVLVNQGDQLNWDLALGRPWTEKVLILISGGWFVLLTLGVGIELLRAKRAPKGWQDMATLAGFLLAAAGLRDLLGVTRSTTTSAFEIIVFLGPLLFLSAILAYRFLAPARTGETSSR